MTTAAITRDAPAAAGRPPLLTRPLLLRFISVIGSSVSFYLLSAAGMASLAATRTSALVIGGAACFGTGFGFLQNATLAMMYARSPHAGYSTVSALWNAAYDTGMGAGAIGIGLVVAHAGYPAAFLLTAALIRPALAPALRERALGIAHDHAPVDGTQEQSKTRGGNTMTAKSSARRQTSGAEPIGPGGSLCMKMN